MKRFFRCTSGGVGAVLILAASGAQAQTTAPRVPSVDFFAPAPAAPVQMRIEPMPGSGASPASPFAPRIDPAPHMAPMPGIEPIPNLAPSPFSRPSQGMAPMPGANGRIPGVIPHLNSGQKLWRYSVPGNEPRRLVVPDTDLRRYFSLAPTPPVAAPRPDTMVVDGDFLYILRGDTVIKMDKKTLAVVGTTTLPAVNLFTAPLPAPRAPILNQFPPSIGQHFGIGPSF